MKSQAKLIDEFKDGATQGKASNMSIDGDTLYSYGRHFPLALRSETPEGYKFLINGDRYSVSTTGHQSRCFELGPQIPFSALRAAKIDPYDINVIEATESEWHRVPDPTPDNPNHYREEHTLGAVLLEYSDRFFLSGLDQNEPWHLGSYFLCELPKESNSVKDAYRSLIPPRVNDCQINPGKPRVLRQGEWFFLPSERETRELPHPSYRNMSIQESTHYVTETRKDADIFVRGTVSHKPPYRRPQHQRLHLGKVWHIVEKNLALESWNAAGGVD